PLPLTLRAARADDFERLLAIDRAAFPPALAYSRRELATWMGGRGCRTLVAAEGEEVVGFVVVCRGRHGLGHLVTLDVAPGRQHRGVGSRLLAAAEEWLWESGVRAIALETAAGEAGARAFYERHGFRATRRLPGYYGGRIDGWLMVKESPRR
ncbi:MAG: GNAT family N-acetyltransferase, partial [Thermoanaerobaculia bacterium]